MKRLFCSLLVLAVVVVARAVTATIYVKAEVAPYLYSWYFIEGSVSQPLGTWPGTLMTEAVEVQGETFWKMNISRPDDVSSFNIIFNNGRGGQTADIVGLSSDHYFTYDGYSGYTDISEDYENVPNAEISQVEIRGNVIDIWIMTKGEGHVYTLTLDLSNVTGDQRFKLTVNGNFYIDIISKLTIDAPDGWVEKQGTYCVLHHDVTDYKSYVFTASWKENIDASEGWTLKVEGKDSKYETIDAQEWQMLAAFYQSVGQGEGWIRKWDFSPSIPSVKTLPGVTAYDGHVVGIDLSNNGITGSFSFALLALPQLESLNLSGNQFSGDLGITTYAFAQQNPTMMTQLQKLNISGNEFSGNIGLFANCFPSLTSLNASGNCLEDVFPMIPTTVTTLDISKQTISRVVPLHLAHLSVNDIATKVPSILLYDHQVQTFIPNINLFCTSQYDSWGMTLSYQNGNLSIPYVSEQNTYYGESGDTLNVEVLSNNGTREGSTFRIKLSYDEGDGNFDGQVDVLDLQTSLMYIMEKYQTRPYNFTAANLWKDEQINIQDIICFVNLLMNTQADASEEVSGARSDALIASHSSGAIVYIKDGILMVSTNQPVAAFDIFVDGLNETDFQSVLGLQGFTCAVEKVNTGIRIIGYSLSGNVLPIGDNAIANLAASSASVRYVMLADSEANAINTSYGHSPTGIMEIDNSITPYSGYYDLQGRRANNPSSQPRKGLYIQKGHKIFK